MLTLDCSRSDPDCRTRVESTKEALALKVHLIVGNAKENPPSLSRCSISSMASPLHPSDPNTPHGFDLASSSFNITPRASCSYIPKETYSKRI
jgi:hypothetical protein